MAAQMLSFGRTKACQITARYCSACRHSMRRSAERPKEFYPFRRGFLFPVRSPLSVVHDSWRSDTVLPHVQAPVVTIGPHARVMRARVVVLRGIVPYTAAGGPQVIEYAVSAHSRNMMRTAE